MDNKINWIRVMGFKHDGSLHRIWDKAALIYEDKEKVMISNSKTLIREHDGRIWMAKEPSVSIYYKNRFFNIMGIIRENGIHYYCNMASPCVCKDKKIKYIDYDLDLVRTVKGEVKILDEDEYNVNKERYNYGEVLERIIKKELSLLKEDALKLQGDFNDDKTHKGHDKFLKIFRRSNNESKNNHQ